MCTFYRQTRALPLGIPGSLLKFSQRLTISLVRLHLSIITLFFNLFSPHLSNFSFLFASDFIARISRINVFSIFHSKAFPPTV